MTKIKFGIAGLGRIGKIHLDNLLRMDEVEVVAVADPIATELEMARKKGIELATTSYETMINSKTLDAVVICTPTDSHADYVEIAAKAGIHVFCEKPLDLNLNRVVEVLEYCQGQWGEIDVGFQ